MGDGATMTTDWITIDEQSTKSYTMIVNIKRVMRRIRPYTFRGKECNKITYWQA